MRATLRAGTTGCAVFLPAVKTIMQYLTIHTGSERKSVSERSPRERGCRCRDAAQGREIRRVGAVVGDARGISPPPKASEASCIISLSLSLSRRSPAIARLLRATVSCLGAASLRFVAASPSPSLSLSHFAFTRRPCFSLGISRVVQAFRGISPRIQRFYVTPAATEREGAEGEMCDIGADIVVGIGGGARLSRGGYGGPAAWGGCRRTLPDAGGRAPIERMSSRARVHSICRLTVLSEEGLY